MLATVGRLGISRGVLIACIVRWMCHDVTMSIPSFVPVEVVERLLAFIRKRSLIPMSGVVAVIDVAGEASGTVKPGAGSDEYASYEPIGTIVPIGGTVIRGIVKVTVGADRRDSDINTDRNLSPRCGHCARQQNGQSSQSKSLPSKHIPSSPQKNTQNPELPFHGSRI